jgi:hypothetical protein
MFRNLGLHIIKFPVGKWGYVGSIPTVLGTMIPASKAAVMGCRSFTNDAGELVEWSFPVFDTEAEAIAFAKSKGCEPSGGK